MAFLSSQPTDCLRIEIDGDLSSRGHKESVMIHRLNDDDDDDDDEDVSYDLEPLKL